MREYDITGTYLKAVSNGMDGDAYQVLYLLETGRFMFTGWWRGYELTIAGGVWMDLDNAVNLQGSGQTLLHDSPEVTRQMRPFERTFNIGRVSFSPELTGDCSLDDWSLLGWRGPLVYAGRVQFFPIEHSGLPRAHEDIDAWVQRRFQEPEEGLKQHDGRCSLPSSGGI